LKWAAQDAIEKVMTRKIVMLKLLTRNMKSKKLNKLRKQLQLVNAGVINVKNGDIFLTLALQILILVPNIEKTDKHLEKYLLMIYNIHYI
jgi:hypothetical protein